MSGPPTRGDALDQLEYEDLALQKLLDAFADPSLDRMQHGVAGKLIVEHLAVREAARELVADGLEKAPELAWASDKLRSGTERRRQRLSVLDEMARGVQPVNINQAQDFDRAVAEMQGDLRSEIKTDLEEVVPVVRRMAGPRTRKLLPSARYVRAHAPTHPGVHRRRWYDRFGPLVRLHALYDVLRGFPTGGTQPSAEVDVGNDNSPL
jgi:hypothetical protein